MDERLTALPVAPFLLVPCEDGAIIITRHRTGWTCARVDATRREVSTDPYEDLDDGGASLARMLEDAFEGSHQTEHHGGLVVRHAPKGREEERGFDFRPGPPPPPEKDARILAQMKDGWTFLRGTRERWMDDYTQIHVEEVLRWCWLP